MITIGRHIITLSLLLLSLSWAKGEDNSKRDTAQASDTKVFISAAIGAGIPLLSYGLPAYLPYNQDPSFQTGYAETGFSFNVNAGYYFKDDLGAMIKIAGNTNGFNSNVFKARSYLANDTNVTASGTAHYVGSYLAGLVLRMPRGVASLDGKLSMNVYALAGLMSLNSSTISETHSTGSGVTTFNSTSALALDFGCGAIYSIAHNLGLSFNLDLLAGNFTFPYYTVTGTGGYPSNVTYDNKTSMSIAIFNPSIGLVLTL